MSGVILDSAAAIANDWRAVAAAWHVIVAALAVTIWRRSIDGRWIAVLLALMPLSVATMAAWSGNPFNATIFTALGLTMLALTATILSPHPCYASDRYGIAGAIMCAVGWFYPHFLSGSAWQYLYAAPLGLLPCPTLAFVIGASLITNSFGSKTWAILVGSLGLLYGVIGVFALRVALDWFLVAGGAILVARAAAPLRIESTTLKQEKRHV